MTNPSNSTTLEARVSNANTPTPRLKRLIAGLFDMVLLFFLHYALYSAIIHTPIADTMNSHVEEMKVIRDGYKLSTGYGKKLYLDLEQHAADYPTYHLFTEIDGESQKYYVVVLNDFPTKAEEESAYKLYEEQTLADDAFQGELTAYHIHNYLITAPLCGGILELIWFLIVPLIKNCGATPGMLIAGIRLISTKYYGKPKWYQYLGRFAFIFLIESLFPYFFLAQWTLLVVPAVHILFIVATPRHRALHDFVSSTMVVDRANFVDIVDEAASLD